MASPETSPTPICTRCQRPIPEGQRLQHRDAMYCLDCVGKSLNGDVSSDRARRRSPGLAVLLSLVPGLGQMYNAQMLKGVIVLVAFLILATGGGPLDTWDHSGLNTALLVTLYFWNLFDAYWTALRINRAELPQVPEAPSFAARPAQSPAAPAWGVLLIVLGVLFLLNNFGATWLTWDRVWPLAILALGIWLLISFALSRRVALPPQDEPPHGRRLCGGGRACSRRPRAPACSLTPAAALRSMRPVFCGGRRASGNPRSVTCRFRREPNRLPTALPRSRRPPGLRGSRPTWWPPSAACCWARCPAWWRTRSTT